MRREWALVFLIVSFHFIGCADLLSISRLTTLPKKKPGDSDHGVAIHLDAQQRLVLVKAVGNYCAEPSPDALAAYASALGLGASIPGKGSGSLADALSSSAGSIGLRTQSITLMRDALYRMCEAFSNRALGPIQTATLLRRSQDLTAVILAVEQLTGAVAANQVILTTGASANASAALMANQQLLDAARKDEDAKKKSLDEATKQRDELTKSVNTKQGEVSGAEAKYNEAVKNKAPAEDQAKLKSDWETRNTDLDEQKRKLNEANTQVTAKQKNYEEARKNRETIEDMKDSSFTSAIANTSGAGQFSPIGQRKELDKAATEAIARSVQAMVQTVIAKEYTNDSCMDMLTFVPEDYSSWSEPQKKGNEEVRKLCITLLSQVIQQIITKSKNSYVEDEASKRIQAAIDKDPHLRAELKVWRERHGLGSNEFLFLHGDGDYAAGRELALKDPELKIP